MKKAKHNRTRKGLVFPPVHKLMGCDLREKMNLAWVKDGKIHGTDGHIMFKLDVATWFIPPAESQLIEGKILHRNHLKKMADRSVRTVTAAIYGVIIEYKNGSHEHIPYVGEFIEDNKFEITEKDCKKLFQNGSEDEGEPVIMTPFNFDAHIPPNIGAITVSKISFDMKQMERIADCFNVNDGGENLDQLTLSFPAGWSGYGYDKILCITSGNNSFYLTPIRVN